MYFKLFVLLAVAAGVSHSAAVGSQSTHVSLVQLIKNAYFKYIKDHKLEDNTDQLITFMMNYENTVTNWLTKIRDVTSVEYKNLVAAHHGNTEISTDEEQLREKFYNLYGKKVMEETLEKTFSQQTQVSSQQSNYSNVQETSQSSSSHKEESSQINSQQSQTNIENSSSVSHQESSSENSNVQQTHETANSIQLSNEKQFSSNKIASNSVSKHESEYSMSGSSLNKEQVYEYNAGYSQGQEEVSTESSGNYEQNKQNLYGSSNNNYDISNNYYHNSEESVNKQESVNEFSHHEENSEIFQNLISNVAQFSKATVNKVATKKLTQQQSQQELLRDHNAHYSFANTADNNIEGNYLQRMETRKDGKVYGRYSYDDGNVFVTRYYFADKNGFRIVREFNEPSRKKGHQLNGEAKVDFTSEKGTRGYKITEQDIHNCQNSAKRRERAIVEWI